MKLTDLPNIGDVLAKKLIGVGINSPEELVAAGSISAIIMIHTRYEGACLNMLYALEGAVRGIRWHHLPREVKEELKEKLNSII